MDRANLGSYLLAGAAAGGVLGLSMAPIHPGGVMDNVERAAPFLVAGAAIGALVGGAVYPKRSAR